MFWKAVLILAALPLLAQPTLVFACDYDAVLSSVAITPEPRAAMDFPVPCADAGQILVWAEPSRPSQGLNRGGKFPLAHPVSSHLGAGCGPP